MAYTKNKMSAEEAKLRKRERDKRYYWANRERFLEYERKRKKENPELVKANNRRAVSKRRFGLNRDEIITDSSYCLGCGISQVEQMELYGCSLNIHHIDGCGRRSMRLGQKPNNNPNNLELLCSSCHTRKHNLLRLNRDYSDPSRMQKAWETRRKEYAKV